MNMETDILKDWRFVNRTLTNPNNKPTHKPALRRLIYLFKKKWGGRIKKVYLNALYFHLDEL